LNQNYNGESNVIVMQFLKHFKVKNIHTFGKVQIKPNASWK